MGGVCIHFFLLIDLPDILFYISSIFGMLATTFTVIIIVIFSILDRPSESPSHTWANPSYYPFAFATFVFAFGGHNVFPSNKTAPYLFNLCGFSYSRLHENNQEFQQHV